MKWTSQQLLAIRTTQADVLLTAAAGSGKTAVLAQRCVHLLTEAVRPCGVEELLVLTFTEAAAGEMKHRIAEALRRHAGPSSRSAHLRRQIALLDQAAISTVHAFCRSVLREFYYAADLDPGFEILDADEAGLLKEQIASELLEECYRPASPLREVFTDFVHRYGRQELDRNLTHLLVRMNHFLNTLQHHQSWLDACRRHIDARNLPDLSQLSLVRMRHAVLARQVDQMISRLRHSLDILTIHKDLEFYRTYIAEDMLGPLVRIRSVLEQDPEQALEELARLDFGKAPAKPRGSGVDTAPVKSHIDAVKDMLGDIPARYGGDDSFLLSQIALTKPYHLLLAELQRQFRLRYDLCKQRRHVLDFDDLEHKTLGLLARRDEEGNLTGITPVAQQLRKRFAYILVDEYQDISAVQEQILQCLKRTGPPPVCSSNESQPVSCGNLFMVGDVKQSIYGFRRADHRIFLEKAGLYAPMTEDPDKPPASGVRINLNRNFRSRRGILDAVNYLFSRTMIQSFADMDYDEEAKLVSGLEASPTDSAWDSSRRADVELYLLERNLPTGSPGAGEASPADLPADLDASRREAIVVGTLIDAMVCPGSSHTLFDAATGSRRAVQYRDIVILLRSVQKHAEIWTEVFRKMNIPVHAELSTGYFAATEIQDMISLLQVLDNPQQDVPLAAALRGPVGNLNESQLAQIRLDFPDLPFHLAAARYARTGPEPVLKEALNSFFQKIRRWRRLQRQHNLARLIWQIYEDTELLAYVLGLSSGRQRYNNLIHLHDRARQFDHFTRQGLSRFLRFLGQLQEQEQDFGPAPMLSEADNVVRILSVHKSKGQEFPVVIAADLARKFNFADPRQPILFGTPETCPVGMNLVNPHSLQSWSTFSRNLLSEDSQTRQIAEELRVLYVALTRAQQKLILAASVPLAESAQKWGDFALYAPRPVPVFALASAKSPIDWIGSAMAGHPDFHEFLTRYAGPQPSPPSLQESSRFFVVACNDAELRNRIGQNPFATGRPESIPDIEAALEGVASAPEEDPRLQSCIRNITWNYPHQALTGVFARCGVSELKRLWNPEPENPETPAEFASRSAMFPNSPSYSPFDLRPRFMQTAESPSGAEIGSCTHLFLQHVPLEASLSRERLSLHLDRLVQRGIFTEGQSRLVDLESTARFFESELGQLLIAQRGGVRREWPFTLAVPVRELYPHLDLAESDPTAPVLLRGIIDCFFPTEKGLILLDYKTDRISTDQCPARAALYRPQLQYYRRALQTILNQPVAQSWLCFLYAGQSFAME